MFLYFSYPSSEQLRTIYGLYLTYILDYKRSTSISLRGTNSVEQITDFMIIFFENLKRSFSPIQHSHYIFTPNDLTHWCLGLTRYAEKADEEYLWQVRENIIPIFSLIDLLKKGFR